MGKNNSTLESIATFHRDRMTVWSQGIFLIIFALLSLICSAAYIAIIQNIIDGFDIYFRYVPGDVIWMIVVSILTICWMGYFLYAEKTAKNTSYNPTLTLFSISVIFALLWLTAAITVTTISASRNYGNLVVSVALADVFGWLNFLGFAFFSIEICGIRCLAWCNNEQVYLQQKV